MTTSRFVDERGQVSWRDVTPAAVSGAMRAALIDAERTFAAIGDDAAPCATIARFFDETETELDFVTGLAEHMEEMFGTEAWRSCHAEVRAAREAFRGEVERSPAVARRIARALAASEGDRAERRVLREVERRLGSGGAALAPEARDELAAIDRALVEQTLAFTHQCDRAAEAYSLTIEEEEARGLPAWAVESARGAAARRGERGLRLTLDMRIVDAVLAFAEDRGLRERIYRAHVTRATSEPDNRPVLREILALRHERAQRLGRSSFAAIALEGGILGAPPLVRRVLAELSERLEPAFRRESAALERRARTEGVAPLEAWDVAFFGERARRETHDFSEEATRPYFPFARVWEAARALTEHLFGVSWERSDAPTYHPIVTAWQLRAGGALVATVYLDPFTREHKREGAWMSPLVPCLPGRGAGTVVLAADIAGSASLDREPCLTLTEVARLLHELGHVMHHVLSRTEHASLAGTRVPVDFVELPSTVLERFAWDREFLARASAHVVTGEPLPQALLERCVRARKFRAASALRGRIALSTIDLELHAGAPPPDAIAFAASITARHSAARLPPGFARIAGLTHVFGSTQGYAARLYAYVWAEALAADAWSRFAVAWPERAAVGRAFAQAVLAPGNEEEPGKLVAAFLGRAPSVDALVEETEGEGT